MRTIAAGAGVMVLAAGLAQAQTETATPKFEVASIKPCREGNGAGRGGGASGELTSPGRVHIPCTSAIRLIAMAWFQYGSGHGDPRAAANALREGRIEGVPAWVHSITYQVDAKAEGTPTEETMLGPMLRALLEDRLGLTIHREARETSVYELTVARAGPKLQAAKDGGCFTIDRDHPPPQLTPGRRLPRPCGGFSGNYMYGTTMANLCGQFSAMLRRPIIDKTGISGAFDIYLDSFLENTRPVAPDGAFIQPDPGTPPTLPDSDVIFPAARSAFKKLGLNLDSARGPVEFLVIDHVERPAEN